MNKGNRILGGLSGLLSNKTVLNSALGMIRNWMLKDGISAVVIAQSDDVESDTPGLSVKIYPAHVGIVTGEEDNADVAAFMNVRDQYLSASNKNDQGIALDIMERYLIDRRLKKEAPNAL